jgi:hypothetical protein
MKHIVFHVYEKVGKIGCFCSRTAGIISQKRFYIDCQLMDA